MVSPEASPVHHPAYLPLHAEGLDNKPPTHYEDMVGIAEALKHGDAQAVKDVYNEVIDSSETYVALADVCDEASRNRALPGPVHSISQVVLDMPSAPTAINIGKERFDDTLYQREQIEPGSTEQKPSSHNRDPGVAHAIHETFNDISFLAQYMAGNSRDLDLAQRHQNKEAEIAASDNPEQKRAELRSKLTDAVEMDKYAAAAQRVNQRTAEIDAHITKLAEIIGNNRDYADLARREYMAVVADKQAAAALINKAREDANKSGDAFTKTYMRRQALDSQVSAATLGRQAAERSLEAFRDKLQEATTQLTDAEKLGSKSEEVAKARQQLTYAMIDHSNAEKRVSQAKAEESRLAEILKRVRQQTGSTKLAADRAQGTIVKAEIGHETPAIMANRLNAALASGELRLDYRPTDAQRNHYQANQQLLTHVVMQAVQEQGNNNTVQQEHGLFVARDQLGEYLYGLHETIKDMMGKHDPGLPELIAHRNKIVDLQSWLQYQAAAARLARARQDGSEQEPNFRGRFELTPVADEGILVHDGTNVVLYPDGSRAHVSDDGTLVSPRMFADGRTVVPRQQQEASVHKSSQYPRRIGAALFRRRK